MRKDQKRGEETNRKRKMERKTNKKRTNKGMTGER
jgi:hypothetical protein